MTTEQLTNLRKDYDEWCNTVGPKADNLASSIMDVLPDVLTHIKHLEYGCDVGTAELKASQKECDGLKAERDSLRSSLNICAGAAGIGDSEELCGWIDAVKAQRDAAMKACADMRVVLEENLKCIAGDYGCPACKTRTLDLLNRTDCGKDFVPKSDLDKANAKCAERGEILRKVWKGDPDCPGAQEEVDHALSADCGQGYHTDSEWAQVVEALKGCKEFSHLINIDERINGWVHQYDYALYLFLVDFNGIDLDAALAHAEKLMGKEEK